MRVLPPGITGSRLVDLVLIGPLLGLRVLDLLAHLGQSSPHSLVCQLTADVIAANPTSPPHPFLARDRQQWPWTRDSEADNRPDGPTTETYLLGPRRRHATTDQRPNERHKPAEAEHPRDARLVLESGVRVGIPVRNAEDDRGDDRDLLSAIRCYPSWLFPWSLPDPQACAAKEGVTHNELRQHNGQIVDAHNRAAGHGAVGDILLSGAFEVCS